MNKKVVLINTWMYSDIELDSLSPHLGLLALATYLKENGYAPVIFDSRKYLQQKKDFWPALNELLKDAYCVGLSVMTAQVDSGVRISDRIKENYPDIPLVWGGYHPSLFPEQTLEDPNIDFILQGEGDWSFLDLLNALNLKGGYDEIDGIGYKRDGKLIFHPQKKYYEINDLPDWDWSFYDVNSFILGGTWSDSTLVRQLPVQNSRGCPYMCSFCINTTLNCYRKWRVRDVKRVVDEIENLIKVYAVEWISFRDEIFFLTKKRIMEFCDEILNRGLKFHWAANARVDFFSSGALDDEVMSKLKKAGCMNLAFGAESGSPKMLKFLRKGVTPEQIILSAKKCNEYGISPVYSFIVGLPGETKEDIMLTYYVMKKIVEFCPSSVLLGPHLYRPYPGCELYDIAKKFGVPESNTLRGWPKILNESFMFCSDPIMRGGHGFKSLPWIYDKKFVSFFITYARYAVYDPVHLIKTKRYHMGLLSLISKLRFKLGFYRLIGIERKIRDFIKK